MKKILYIILCISTLFIFASCKKNEPVGRVTNDFLSDFVLYNETDYEIYDAITKEECVDNRLGRRYKPLKLISFSFESNKKVIIKNISFRIYNFSETESFNIFVLDGAYCDFVDKEICQINSLNDEVSWHTETIAPGEYFDVKLDFNSLKINKNTQIELFYGTNYNVNIQGRDINEENVILDMMNTIKNSAGICNFKIEYVVYMKI